MSDIGLPALASLAPGERPGTCPVCGTQECRPPAREHLSTYPFLPGGKDPMAGKDYVIAPHRIVDADLGRVMYGTGDRVPMADAVKYGLVEGGEPTSEAVEVVEAPRPQTSKKGRRTRHHEGPEEDR